jgi:hypothetical protein
MDKYPCGSSEIEKVEVRVQVCERGEKGEIVNRSRRTFVLDPTQYNLSEMQQYEREHGAAGEAVEHHKIGKPFLVLSGTVVGGQNDVIVEPPHHCLDVGVEKVANLVTIYFLWQGKEVEKYQVTEQALLVENMKHHTGLMIDRVQEAVGRENISPGQIRQGLIVAISNQMGIPITQM